MFLVVGSIDSHLSVSLSAMATSEAPDAGLQQEPDIINSLFVLFYPIGSRKWNIRQRAHPDASIVGSARHGNRECVEATQVVEGTRWLRLARGGWVRQKHVEFMQWRWPHDTQAEAYYGWHPSDQVTDKMIQAAEHSWTVPVDIAAGGCYSGYSYMAHPNLMWSAAQFILVAMLLLVVLLFLKHTVFGL